jgi:Protein of unknown function (DUF4197)
MKAEMQTQPDPHLASQRRHLIRWLAALACTGSLGTARAAGLSAADASAGLRAALDFGARAAVAQLGKTDGFLANPLVHIPLPDTLQRIARLLRATGQSKRLDELETAMNRAAELAVPQAQTLLIDAVKSMTVDDAAQILRGSDTAVTEFFAGRTREPLTEKFLPIVGSATEQVSLARKYNAVASRASRFGLVSAENANLQQFVTGKALDGLYKMIGEEEKKIRQDPVGTGQAILEKVFGALKK